MCCEKRSFPQFSTACPSCPFWRRASASWMASWLRVSNPKPDHKKTKTVQGFPKYLYVTRARLTSDLPKYHHHHHPDAEELCEARREVEGQAGGGDKSVFLLRIHSLTDRGICTAYTQPQHSHTPCEAAVHIRIQPTSAPACAEDAHNKRTQRPREVSELVEQPACLPRDDPTPEWRCRAWPRVAVPAATRHIRSIF